MNMNMGNTFTTRRSSSCARCMPGITSGKRSTRRPGIQSISFVLLTRTERPEVVVESRKATVEELRRRGQVVEISDDWSDGRLTAASREGPRPKAATNARGMQGYAAGR